MKIKKRHTFLAVLVIVLIALFLNNTTLIGKTLFEKEESGYELYLRENFKIYLLNSEILDSSTENLERWSSGGSITAWTNIENWKEISRIDLELTDSSGKKVILNGINNIKLPREYNEIKSDDPFPDYYFNCDQDLNKWEDFMIVNGRNFIFWEYNNSLNIDMSNIVSWKTLNGESEIESYDFVIHDGLCERKNSLSGDWYSPNGLPQYGVWWPEENGLIMRNVEQEQYPSNGDHVRILSAKETPENFIMKTRFRIDKLESTKARYTPNWIKYIFGMSQEDPLRNTYIRFAWDFDNEYDPGHDQSLIYYTFEYNYLGLQRVYPIERYFVQGFEPKQSNKKAKTKISLKEGKTYEINLKVDGQKATAEVYRVGSFYMRKIGEIEYEFDKERSTKDYPFSVETTGDVEIILESIEVKKR